MSDEPKQTLKKLNEASLPSKGINKKRLRRKGKKRGSLQKARWRKKRYLKANGLITEELCETVKFFDVKDTMDWTSSSELMTAIPSEITEWQKQDQIAYWKSRAISLESENRMLHRHIRDVYTKQIEDYHLMSQHWVPKIDNSNTKQKKSGKKDILLSQPSTFNNNHTEKVLPNLPEGKNRVEEMTKIYGKSAQKIMGMETALQLNFERYTEHSKVPYWPSLPLNLKMDQ